MPVRLRGASRDAAALSTACTYVGPHSWFANPFKAGDSAPSPLGSPMDAAEAVDLFADTLRSPVGRCYAARFARALRGRDLMCTCPLDVPCHTDVLLRIANDYGDGDTIRTCNFPGRPAMSHPIMFAAAKHLTTAEEQRTAAREKAFRTWGPRSVAAASKYARRLLGDEAVTLDWEVLSLLSFEEHLQAFALLDTVGGQHLELYYTDQGGTERILLRVSCVSCPSQHMHEVTSLEQLVQLLSLTPAWPSIDPRDGGNL